MAKLVCVFSFIALLALHFFDRAPDISGATIRLTLALTFSASLLALARRQLEELIG